MYASKKEIEKIFRKGLLRTIFSIIIAWIVWVELYSSYIGPIIFSDIDFQNYTIDSGGDFFTVIKAGALFLAGGVLIMLTTAFLVNWGRTPKCPECGKPLLTIEYSDKFYPIVARTGICPNCGFCLIKRT